MAIDTAQKRSAVMGMGAPAGAILSYPTGTIDIIGRASLLNIGFTASIVASVLRGLDVESTFDITRLITSTFELT